MIAAFATNFIWEGYIRPRLNVEYAVGLVQLRTEFRSDTAIFKADLQDGLFPGVVATARVRASREDVYPIARQGAIMTKIHLFNQSRIPLTNIRVAVKAPVNGRVFFRGSGNLGAVTLDSLEWGEAGRIDAIQVPVLPPGNHGIVTLLVFVDSLTLSTLLDHGTFNISFPFFVANEIPSHRIQTHPIPVIQAARIAEEVGESTPLDIPLLVVSRRATRVFPESWRALEYTRFRPVQVDSNSTVSFTMGFTGLSPGGNVPR